MKADEFKKVLEAYLLSLSQDDKPLSVYSEQEKQICKHLLESLENLKQGILFPSNTKLSLYDGLNTNSIIYVSALRFFKENPNVIDD